MCDDAHALVMEKEGKEEAGYEHLDGNPTRGGHMKVGVWSSGYQAGTKALRAYKQSQGDVLASCTL